MLTAPTAGKELDPKTMDQKEYWWCTVLNCWYRHKPEDCRGARQSNQGSQQPRDTKRKGRKNRMLRAAQALIEGADTGSEDEEE